MFEVDLPEDQTVPETHPVLRRVRGVGDRDAHRRSTSATRDLPGAISHWRSWLAGRGAGLVPLAKPASFNWPGYWLAVLGRQAQARTLTTPWRC